MSNVFLTMFGYSSNGLTCKTQPTLGAIRRFSRRSVRIASIKRNLTGSHKSNSRHNSPTYKLVYESASTTSVYAFCMFHLLPTTTIAGKYFMPRIIPKITPGEHISQDRGPVIA